MNLSWTPPRIGGPIGVRERAAFGMQITQSKQSYSASHYDDHFCLKPPMLLWAAVLFLSRAITLPLIVGLGNFAGVNPDALSLLRRFWSMEILPASILAAIVLYALLRRVPGASAPVRWLWAQGRVILALSAGIDLALSLLAAAQSVNGGDVFLNLASAAFDAYFLLYLLFARRARDTFADFPPAYDTAKN